MGMYRGNKAGSDDAGLLRARWVIPPQVGRLVPLALQTAEREPDATLHAVTTGGLSQKQTGETPPWERRSSPLAVAPWGIPAVLLRHLLSKARRFP